MGKARTGHVEQLPSGAFRAVLYAGTDPLTRRQQYLKSGRVSTEEQARIELGKLLEQAAEGQAPETGVTVAKLLDEYAAVAGWDVSTRATNEGFIRRTINPALGYKRVREVRGPLLDKFYARLRKCGDLSCTGAPFTEHRNVPVIAIDPSAGAPPWQQATAALREAIASGTLAPGDELPSIAELNRLQGIGTGTTRRALAELADEGLIIVRHGRAAIVAGDPTPRAGRWRPGPGHECRRAGCRPHICRPMEANTIRGIHGILSGAFAAAVRWDWTSRNPAESARPPTASRKPVPATPPEDVAKVIAEARARSAALGLYVWLVAITGARRGELCAVQVRDIDLDGGLIHVAFNYVVRGGRRVRKDTKTHQDRWLAIDPDTCALIREYLGEIRAALALVGVELASDGYLFSSDPLHARPWNPDWATHQVADASAAAGVPFSIKGGRHYTASQLLVAGFDRRNTAARLGHSGGGATTLRYYADPVPEADRRAAAYLSRLTSGTASPMEQEGDAAR
jgi:integrase